MREGATPCRRSSARRVCSSGARLLPLTRAPRLSLPSQAKGVSRLIALSVLLAAGAIGFFRPASLDGDAVDFLETGQPVLHLLEPGAPQIPHAFLGSLVGDLHRTAHGENDARNRIGHWQHLVDTCAALVAVGAVPATLGSEELEPTLDLRFGKA